MIPDAVRPGAFLPSVPVSRRIGDYKHCAARVCTTVIARLRGEGDFRLIRGKLALIVVQCNRQARQLLTTRQQSTVDPVFMMMDWQPRIDGNGLVRVGHVGPRGATGVWRTQSN